MRFFCTSSAVALFFLISPSPQNDAVVALSTGSFGKFRQRFFSRKTGQMPPLDPPPNGDVQTQPKLVSRVRPTKNIENIFKQNREWVESKDVDYFKEMGSEHRPSYFWIGCADARVPANEIMGEDFGSVFVVRNVANMVVNTDFNLMSALQYAVNYLKIPHIIVCGHYDCGGVRASTQNADHVPPLENWLRNIRDVYRLHRKELDAIKDPEKRHRRLVEINVIEQCLNLFKTGAVQRRRVETYKNLHPYSKESNPDKIPYTTPRIHACVFDPKTGILKELPVNFKQVIDQLHGIYDLYSLDDANQ